MGRKKLSIIAIRVVLFSFLVMIFFCADMASGEPISKPGCPSRCGNVTVPFPFGIGGRCFLDRWFEIVCADDAPFLNTTGKNLRVTEIGIDGTVQAIRSDLDTNTNTSSAEFEGSPLEFPEVVPLVIRWELWNYSTADVFGTALPVNQTGAERRFFFDPEENAYRAGPPLVNSSCQVYNRTWPRLRCSCPEGYVGNPYLIEGCEDIDECSALNRTGSCVQGSECLNVGGGFMCTSIDRKKSSRVRPILIGIGSGLGALLLLMSSWGIYKLVKRRKEIQRKQLFFKRNGGLLLQQQVSSNQVSVERTKLFDAEELKKATDHFNENRILGQGGQGTVYKGMLADGNIVAVKKSKILDREKVTEFINEVVILSQINHRNVVKLLGCCLEAQVPLLVYEFIPNGTLSHYIQDPNGDIPLTWEMRLRIATEIAGALSYLHSSATYPIYHRDIKSTNILLDEKYRAKVADFGTSRAVSIDKTHLTTLVHGTFGYLDPEYFQSSQFTDKSDVYSFGVVLVELLTGQKPVSITKSNEGRSLAAQFMAAMEENRLFEMVDDRVAREGEEEAVAALAALAERCLNLNGKRRPAMKEVAAELERILKSVEGCDRGERDLSAVHYVVDEVVEPEPLDLFTNSISWSGLRAAGAASSSTG